MRRLNRVVLTALSRKYCSIFCRPGRADRGRSNHGSRAAAQEQAAILRPDTVVPSPDITSTEEAALEHLSELDSEVLADEFAMNEEAALGNNERRICSRSP